MTTPGASRSGLEAFTWAYIAWSILPVIIAITFSFNAGRSRSTWQGFSLRWWWEDPTDSLFHDPALRSAIVQSLKLSFGHDVHRGALWDRCSPSRIDRWHRRPARFANFVMLFSFVMPEIIIGVSLFLLFRYLLQIVRAAWGPRRSCSG